MANLTDKQKAWAYAYVECLNKTEAAALAQYQGDRVTLAIIGYENYRKPKIRALVDQLLNERAMQANEVVSRLSDHARGIPADCFDTFGPMIAINFDKLREHGLLHLIQEVSYDGEGRPKVKIYGAQTALIHLGKLHALFTDTIKHEDWRDTALEYIRSGEVSYKALADEFGTDLATELFAKAGKSVTVGAGTSEDD